MKKVMIERDPCVSIEEAMRLTGWSRKELLQRIGRGEISIKFGNSKELQEIRNYKDHPAYKIAQEIINEYRKKLDSPEFRVLLISKPLKEEAVEWWQKVTEASELQAAVYRMFHKPRRRIRKKVRKNPESEQ